PAAAVGSAALALQPPCGAVARAAYRYDILSVDGLRRSHWPRNTRAATANIAIVTSRQIVYDLSESNNASTASMITRRTKPQKPQARYHLLCDRFVSLI